jgi:hypothetical protein
MSSRPNRTIARRFSLRALLIVMLLAGPLGGWGWTRWQAWQEWKTQQEARQLQEQKYAAATTQLQAILKSQAALQVGSTRRSGIAQRRVKERLEGIEPPAEPAITQIESLNP